MRTLDARYGETEVTMSVVADEQGVVWSTVEGRTGVILTANSD